MGRKVLPTFATGYFQDLANSFLNQPGVTKSPSCWAMILHMFPSSVIPFTLHFTLPHIQNCYSLLNSPKHLSKDCFYNAQSNRAHLFIRKI